MKREKSIAAALALSSALAATPALAGGFYVQEQSAIEAGRAYSGEAAAADSGATIFFNPAGMTELEGINFEAGGQLLFVTARQENTGSTRTVPGAAGTFPVTGSDGGNPFAQPIPIPSFYASAQLSDRVWVGLGVNSPFGVASGYEDDFFGRFDAVQADLLTFNVQPSVAFKVSENLSIGGGVDIQYIHTTLVNALPNLAPSWPAGRFEIEGDDISLGFNVGALIKAGPLRFGAHYRSQVEHLLEGPLELSGLEGPLAVQNGTYDATTPITMPDIATLSVAIDPGGKWRGYATARHYDWSDFDRIDFITAQLPTTTSPQNYADTMSIAAGGEYDFSGRLTLRAGTMWDESPVGDTFRSTRVPDGDRTWLSAGATYRLGGHMALNLAYSHVFVASEPVNRVSNFYTGSPAQTTVVTRSNSTGDADILAFSLSTRF
jgi:long-chain fatty acid transport protein